MALKVIGLTVVHYSSSKDRKTVNIGGQFMAAL